MSEPLEEVERAVAAHIATMVNEGIRRGVAGDWRGAVETMRPLFYTYGPDEAYVWTRAMLRRVPMHAPDCDCDGPVAAQVVHQDPLTGRVRQVDIDDPDVPSGVRTLARMLAAHGNGDDDTVRALWEAVVGNEDTEALGEIMHRTLLYAVQSAAGRG